ncbi:hypothetical protein Ddye_020563 [Dipteronia dyeriana]|uniref:Uncharacterized protein n=1 Tax=Dipteronia dyeriana TaxID=168575 RepID=A0AAD9U0S8_9ROSI|nr:hypothetical protein Ddye_020563 [Dipteronia dyeriana]
MSEMSAWLDLQTAKRENNTETILKEFISRFIGSLRDWYQALREYRYHALGGINDESLRQVYLNSLPTELQCELQRLVKLSNRTLRDISLGEIHMFTHTALDKLCTTQRVFAKMIQERKKYDKHCKLPDSFHLKCKNTDHCICSFSRRSRGQPLRSPPKNQPQKERVFSNNRR